MALADLVGINHDDKVWLVHDVTMPSLTELAWQQAPEAIIAIVAAALIWLWSLGKRLGPQLPPAQTPRRDIGEHLAAGFSYPEAIRLANTAAGIAVGKLGTAAVTRAELMDAIGHSFETAAAASDR